MPYDDFLLRYNKMPFILKYFTIVFECMIPVVESLVFHCYLPLELGSTFEEKLLGMNALRLMMEKNVWNIPSITPPNCQTRATYSFRSQEKINYEWDSARMRIEVTFNIGMNGYFGSIVFVVASDGTISMRSQWKRNSNFVFLKRHNYIRKIQKTYTRFLYLVEEYRSRP